MKKAQMLVLNPSSIKICNALAAYFNLAFSYIIDLKED